MNQVQARTLERKFLRSVQKRGFFTTASGCVNTVELSGQILLVSTSKKESNLRISREKIRRAIAYMQGCRTAIRKDMEQFSPFSSALFGMLVQIFKGESKLQSLKNGLYRLSLLGVRYYASGLERDPFLRKEFKNLGGKYVLFNYYQLLQSSFDWLSWLEDEDVYCLIDSGAYSDFQNKQKVKKSVYQQQQLFDEEALTDQYIEGYAQFINEYKVHPRVIGFFPFDCIGDPEKTRENEQRLKNLTDAKIFSVWQFTDSLDELQRLVEEEPEMIGIGGMVPYLMNRMDQVRTVLKRIFSKFSTVNFHLLGIANELLLEFPCFSSDSTSFLNARKSEKQRQVYLEEGTRIPALREMSTLDIIKQNLRFLLSLENFNKTKQLVFDF